MSGLAELLKDPKRLLSSFAAKAPEPVALRRANGKLEGTVVHREVEDVPGLQARIAEAASGGAMTTISRRDLRDACRVFFHPPMPPGRDPEVGRRVIIEVDRLKRRAAFLTLIEVYLDAFSPTDTDVEDLGHRLSELSGHWPWREADLWPARAVTFGLFETARAPKLISKAVLSSEVAVRTVLDDAGLNTDARRRGGLAEAAFKETSNATATLRGPAAIPPQLKLIEWAEAGAHGLAFPRAWADFANALFAPWKASEPPETHKRLLIDTGLSCAGDPRMNRSRWRPVEDANADAYEVIVRWLTRASVEQFFDIVSETMTDRPDMWAQRRQFWTSYLKANLISEAWVAFGSDGAWRAQEAARRSGEQGFAMFGRLSSGGGRTAEHAALIMQIGDLTVVEWSHNGRWNIWRRGDPKRPQLFRRNSQRRPDYDPHELMGAPISGAHLGSWQRTVAERIRNETGLRP